MCGKQVDQNKDEFWHTHDLQQDAKAAIYLKSTLYCIIDFSYLLSITRTVI